MAKISKTKPAKSQPAQSQPAQSQPAQSQPKPGGKAAAEKAPAKSGDELGGSAGKLANETVALIGQFGAYDTDRRKYAAAIERLGGKVVDAEKTVPDYVFVGEGRGGKPPSLVAKIQKKAPAVQVLDRADFHQLLLPEPEELRRAMQAGEVEWDLLNRMCEDLRTRIDLSQADLRKAKLRVGAHLHNLILTGADFRGASFEFTHFGALDQVNFDECVGKHMVLGAMTRCTFRVADLEDAWMFYPGQAGAKGPPRVEDCDFSAASLHGVRMARGALVRCTFVEGDLTGAIMQDSVFEHCDFTKADLSQTNACQAKFVSAVLVQANLTRANFRGASLGGADLRNATLCAAVLNDADLTGADVAGADFQDAILTGAKLDGVDFSKAKNYRPPVVRTAGPKIAELVAAVQGATGFSTSAQVDLGQNEFAELSLRAGGSQCMAQSNYCREGNRAYDQVPAPNLAQGLLNLAERWPGATLRLDSVQAKGSKVLRGAKLQATALAAWAEAFGLSGADAEGLKAGSEAQQAQALRERDELMKQIRSKGTKVWDAIDYHLRQRFDLSGADLSQAKLDKIDLHNQDLRKANFQGSSLENAQFWGAKLQDADFSGAKLADAKFQSATLQGARFHKADLSGADLQSTKLQGADFTGAKLKGAKLAKAQFDQQTILPSGFEPPADMVWKGDGARPGLSKAPKAAQAGSLDFDTFLKELSGKIDAGRMAKARSMLKAARFQLFADVKDDALMGIVKSQTDKDLVYSCRLAKQGAFSCCTQNLRPCGGLQGALCKHLLVLILGLAKAGELDCATVAHWVELSRGHQPALDADLMSATFLRYKGAEAGEIDWRPTETIPEDFYTM